MSIILVGIDRNIGEKEGGSERGRMNEKGIHDGVTEGEKREKFS